MISSVWVYVSIFFSVQDYVFIYFLCLDVCVDCFFLFRIMCLLISPVWMYVLIVFFLFGYMCLLFLFCLGMCTYLFFSV